jgi:uncharacterized protein DUF3237
MPILAAGQRRYLIDKGLVYLFSYDLPWTSLAADKDRAAREVALFPVPGGARLESHLRNEPRPRPAAPAPSAGALPFSPWEVYHVHDDISVEGNDAIAGSVKMSRDSLFLPREERFGTVEGALVIVTDDAAVIDSRYRGSIALGTLGLGHFDEQEENEADGEQAGADGWLPPGATPGAPTRVKLFITPRFETAYPKYKWLTERQCAGFGVVDIENGRPARATIDIYALKSESPR